MGSRPSSRANSASVPRRAPRDYCTSPCPATFHWSQLGSCICAVPFCRQTPLTLKALRAKDYSEKPQTRGQHLMKSRRKLGLYQREAAAQMGILTETYANWEKDKTKPVASQFRPVVAFLGYDPTPRPRNLRERFEARRRALPFPPEIGPKSRKLPQSSS